MGPEDDSLGPLGAQPLGVFVRGGDHGFFNEAFRGEHVRVWARDGLSILVPVNRGFGRHGEDDGACPAACFLERVRALAKDLEFVVTVFEALLGFVVGDPPLDPHPGRTHRLPGGGPSIPVHVDDGEQGSLRFLARERARVLAQDLRTHGDRLIREIDALSPVADLLVELGSGSDDGPDICDCDEELPAVLRFLAVHGVVMVLGPVRINHREVDVGPVLACPVSLRGLPERTLRLAFEFRADLLLHAPHRQGEILFGARMST